ncbi:MAG: hypothetical protein JWN63_2674 [Candidatus Acidoferrum typicum]|nr:hypothetical protein [Candidatus Acidoferrum typicum]
MVITIVETTTKTAPQVLPASTVQELLLMHLGHARFSDEDPLEVQ